MSGSVIRHVIVRGTVQGVGFRVFVQRRALERGLGGWVRNRRDGSVEAVLAGPVAEVDAALAALRKGPSSAKVTALQVSEAGEPELRERLAGEVFSMLRTV
jgi:acylphosphatase